MALTNVQNEFLKLQLQNNPEFIAEYFPNVITEGPTGPLYDVDRQYDRPANVSYQDGAEFRDVNVPYDTEGSRINIKATPRERISQLDIMQADMLDKPFPRPNPDYTTYAYMKPDELFYKGQPVHGSQTQRINMAPWILDSYGTAPSSPRNEMVNTPEWWHNAGKDFGFETGDTVDQATLNDFIESVLAHETSHGIADLPLHTKDTDKASFLDFSQFLTPNQKQSNELRDRLDISKMDKWDKQGYIHAQEELFNRMKDIERLKTMFPNDYEDHPLWELYQNRAQQHFSMLTGQTWNMTKSLGKFDLYKKKIKPYVDKYFERVEKKGRGISDINIRKEEIGMPQNLTLPPKRTYTAPKGGGGADVMPIPQPKKKYVSPARPHSADPPSGGGQRGSMPTGTAGKNPWGRAQGGLIDIPLPGRRRDI